MPETVPRPAAPGEAVPLETFTDEELSILAGSDGIVVSPFLDRIGADQRATAERTAYRGLLARGIVDPPAPGAVAGANGGAVELPVREDVHALIALRGSAEGVVAIARTGSGGRTSGTPTSPPTSSCSSRLARTASTASPGSMPRACPMP